MKSFALAVRRELRGQAPADWQQRVGAIPGIQVQGESLGSVLQIQADEDAEAALRRELGAWLHIEPLALRERMDER